MYVTFEYHYVTSNVTFLRNIMMLYSDVCLFLRCKFKTFLTVKKFYGATTKKI